MITVKFTFHLKSGKVFECIEELENEQFMSVVLTCRDGFRQGIDGAVTFEDCCIRLSDCSVVEWEILDE